jgi:hypothetical protein
LLVGDSAKEEEEQPLPEEGRYALRAARMWSGLMMKGGVVRGFALSAFETFEPMTARSIAPHTSNKAWTSPVCKPFFFVRRFNVEAGRNFLACNIIRMEWFTIAVQKRQTAPRKDH